MSGRLGFRCPQSYVRRWTDGTVYQSCDLLHLVGVLRRNPKEGKTCRREYLILVTISFHHLGSLVAAIVQLQARDRFQSNRVDQQEVDMLACQPVPRALVALRGGYVEEVAQAHLGADQVLLSDYSPEYLTKRAFGCREEVLPNPIAGGNFTLSGGRGSVRLATPAQTQ